MDQRISDFDLFMGFLDEKKNVYNTSPIPQLLVLTTLNKYIEKQQCVLLKNNVPFTLEIPQNRRSGLFL